MNDLNANLRARLVWDGGDDVRIPSEMGVPALLQMEGAAGERLSELAGRICYDSLGKGRSSVDYHRHIKEVGHFSVYEHAHLTVEIKVKIWELAPIFFNRPGLWMSFDGGDTFRVTFNPRHILEWDSWSQTIGISDLIALPSDFKIGTVLAYHAERAWPTIVPPRQRAADHEAWIRTYSQVVEPTSEDERWVSLFMSGSRGFSHELVRHGDFTAISQRSTRFVDESESDWVDHPLVQEYMRNPDVSPIDRESMRVALDEVKDPAKAAYSFVVDKLQPWLIARGVDKTSSRKQARGAARGYLGNALYTELIFSASVAQWKRMMRMRACAAADAEIRAVFVKALSELRQSRYADCFSGFQTVPSSDGIGETVWEAQHVKV